MTPVVVFTTASDIEASVVMALLDSHGIDAFRVSGNPQGIWPMAVSSLGQIRVAVAAPDAEQARRVIDSHRQDVGARVVRLRDEFDDLQSRIAYRFRDRGLLEHALTHKSRAAEDAKRTDGGDGRRRKCGGRAHCSHRFRLAAGLSAATGPREPASGGD